MVVVLYEWLSAGSDSRGPAMRSPCADQRGDAVDRSQAYEAVDDPARHIGLAEVETEDPGDEIELRDCDQAPVEAADEQKHGGDQIELAHYVYLLSRCCPDPTCPRQLVSNICPDLVILNDMSAQGRFRIGELSRRSGVSPDLLRAWERRYGLLSPSRSAGGLRLYSEEDLLRVRAMQRQLDAGLAAAEAAAVATSQEATTTASDTTEVRRELGAALLAFDEARAHAALDALVARFSLDTVVADIVVPYLHDLGEQWERGEISVAQEHFASSLLRGRLLGLGRGWGQGHGPTALLACAPGEQHDLGLIAFGLALRARGWRIIYLGADTPLESLAGAARSAQPDCVVISAVDPRNLDAARESLGDLARDYRIAVGGAAASGANLGEDILTLTGGPVDEAERLTLA